MDQEISNYLDSLQYLIDQIPDNPDRRIAATALFHLISATIRRKNEDKTRFYNDIGSAVSTIEFANITNITLDLIFYISFEISQIFGFEEYDEDDITYDDEEEDDEEEDDDDF